MAAPVQTSLPLLQEGGARPAPHRPRFAGNHEKRVAGLGRALREAMAPEERAAEQAVVEEGWPLLACVTVPSLALQRLLLREPSWAGAPVAVVEADRPSARLLEVNGMAWRQRVRPGLRYAAALSLLGNLRAAVVAPEELAAAGETLAARLALLSPRVEPKRDEPGVFWLDLTGMQRLIPSLPAWCDEVVAALKEAGYRSTLAVGFSRFGTYATARTVRGVRRYGSGAEERAAVAGLALERLPLEPAVRETMERLGVVTVGQFAALPAAGLRQRLGEGAEALHRWMQEGGSPAEAWQEERQWEAEEDLEAPESRSEALVFWMKRTLERLLATLHPAREVVSQVSVELRLDDGLRCPLTVRPAEPTAECGLLLDLLRLRLEGYPLTAGVVRYRMRLEVTGAGAAQSTLWSASVRRDPAAAARALARLRADLGEGAVGRLEQRPGHLPEAQSLFVPCSTFAPAQPCRTPVRVLVRYLQDRPIPLESRQRSEPDGWLVAGLAAGPVDERSGPFVISGGWWAREVRRDYYFVKTRRGDLLWIYHDRVRRRWFLQGGVA